MADSLKLLGRVDCHLCEVAQRELDLLGVAYEVVDIDEDEQLEALYNEAIPVLLYGDVELARAPIEAGNLRNAIESLKLPRAGR